MTSPVKAVILAGGSGSRLWPLSRQQLPKQFLHLSSNKTLLQETIERLHPLIGGDDVWIVTGEEHAKGEAYAALKPYQVILEPEGRNTAPAIALAASLLMEEGNDPVLVVLPADHVIRDCRTFRACLRRAISEAERGRLVTFGIQPTRADTGFGYIQVSGTGEGEDRVHNVVRFTEKPDSETAASFLRQGNYFWNSGMFVWRASAILEEVKRYLPGLYEVLEDMRRHWRRGVAWQEVIRREFCRMPSISIDYGVLEHSDRVCLIPCDIGWSDVGSWDAVFEIADKDDHDNALEGNVIALDCEGSLLRSEKRLLAAAGVRDMCVVETADAILIVPRGQSQRVREIVDTLQARQASEHVLHPTVQRPWGSYTVLMEDASYKIKQVEVAPGEQLSLQMHHHRSEHWVVVSGVAEVQRGEEWQTVHVNESTYIPKGMKHRIRNPGKVPLKIIEVQSGEYVGEDDIVRFDDCYGRKDNP
jgi:mannose-1-phosphate guanylyltransferase/mannose-6-phosphate isomerase